MNGYRSIFLNATSQKLRDLRARSAAKYSKDGRRLLRPAIPIEFDLPAFRAWALERFRDERGTAPCEYCGRPLTPGNFVPDHDTPLAHGGPNTLENLVLSCEGCNDEKGELSGRWYRLLRRFLETWPAAEADSVRSRLKKAEKAASTIRSMRHRLQPKPLTAEETTR